MPITWEDFEKVDMQVGRILTVEDFPQARKPSYRLTIDFGPEIGIKKSSVAIQPWYTKDELQGRLIVAVVNFPPKQIANFFSEVLVLGAIQPDGEVIFLHPGKEANLGARIA